jgi:hypothetical protein
MEQRTRGGVKDQRRSVDQPGYSYFSGRHAPAEHGGGRAGWPGRPRNVRQHLCRHYNRTLTHRPPGAARADGEAGSRRSGRRRRAGPARGGNTTKKARSALVRMTHGPDSRAERNDPESAGRERERQADGFSGPSAEALIAMRRCSPSLRSCTHVLLIPHCALLIFHRDRVLSRRYYLHH